MATTNTYTTSFKRNPAGYYQAPTGRRFAGNSIDAYTKRFNDAAQRFQTIKQGDSNYNALGNRIKLLGSRYGFDWQNVLGRDWKPYQAPAASQPAAPVATPPAQPEAPAAAPQPPAPTFEYQQSPMTKALLDAMNNGLSTAQAYEPKFYEGSPLYQFQKQQGQRDLEKLMAARGLTGSGAEVQANSDFLSKLNADESEKARQYAEEAANRQNQAMQFLANFDKEERQSQLEQWNKNTDRQIDMQQFDANRQDRRNEVVSNFLTNILGLQSQNDIARLSQSGLTDQTALSKALSDMISRNIANDYTRAYGGGGGQAPIAPNSGNSDIMSILMRYGDRAGNNDVIDGLLRMFSGK
ncbi:MAG: hypothetical protein EBZ48_13295 [Proteobacteria bacterium]|nr:hypothetical protein [Pseudomonadota bacterium]